MSPGQLAAIGIFTTATQAEVGALAIPGIGLLIAAGPLMAGLAGLGVGGHWGASAARWWEWQPWLARAGAEDVSAGGENSAAVAAAVSS